jgi:hypothetical protein
MALTSLLSKSSTWLNMIIWSPRVLTPFSTLKISFALCHQIHENYIAKLTVF